MSKTVAIIDYGMGNLHSVASAVAKVAPEAEVLVTADHSLILSADHVIFPGVGAIRDCMHEIRRLGVDRVVQEVIDKGTPLLAVCVGMQALMSHSEENNGVDCMGIFPAQVKLFRGQAFSDHRMKVPHMGWNNVTQRMDHPVWKGIAQNTRFYFVHSYYVNMHDEPEVIGRCEYGVTFAAALAHKNIVAVQFHPEKSHDAGLRLVKNFLEWNGK